MTYAANAMKEEFLTRAWSDAAFRARLEENPKAVLAEMGAAVPEGVEVKIVQDSANVKYLHVPAAPAEGRVGDEELAGAQGGMTCHQLTVMPGNELTVIDPCQPRPTLPPPYVPCD